MSAPSQSGVGHRELLDAAGITYRQLQHWCERGFFGDHNRGIGTGARRSFTEADEVVMRALARLSRTVGFGGGRSLLRQELPRIVEWVRAGKRGPFELGPGVTLHLSSLTAELRPDEIEALS